MHVGSKSFKLALERIKGWRQNTKEMAAFEGWMLSKGNSNELTLSFKVCLPISTVLMHKHQHIQQSEYFIYKCDTKWIKHCDWIQERMQWSRGNDLYFGRETYLKLDGWCTIMIPNHTDTCSIWWSHAENEISFHVSCKAYFQCRIQTNRTIRWKVILCMNHFTGSS